MSVYEARRAGQEYCNTEGSKHYKGGEVEPLDLIFSLGYGEGFCMGSAIKYASRFKETRNLNDLKKISDYAHILCGVEILREQPEIATSGIFTSNTPSEPKGEYRLGDNAIEQEADTAETHEQLVERAERNRAVFCGGFEGCAECQLASWNNGKKLKCRELCQQHPQLALDLMQGKAGE